MISANNSSLVAYSIVDASNMAASVAAAFTLFRERAARFAALTFPEGFRPGPQTTPLIAQELERAGAIEVLVLVQNSSAIGFVASSVGLRSPRVRIVTARKVEDIDLSALRGINEAGGSSPLTSFEMSPTMLIDDAIKSGFDLFRGRAARSAAIVFPKSVRLASTVTSTLVTHLDGAPSIRVFFLVHEGSAAGFVAAAVGLRVPNVRVRAMTSLAAVQRFLQFTTTGSD